MPQNPLFTSSVYSVSCHSSTCPQRQLLVRFALYLYSSQLYLLSFLASFKWLYGVAYYATTTTFTKCCCAIALKVMSYTLSWVWPFSFFITISSYKIKEFNCPSPQTYAPKSNALNHHSPTSIANQSSRLPPPVPTDIARKYRIGTITIP